MCDHRNSSRVEWGIFFFSLESLQWKLFFNGFYWRFLVSCKSLKAVSKTCINWSFPRGFGPPGHVLYIYSPSLKNTTMCLEVVSVHCPHATPSLLSCDPLLTVWVDVFVVIGCQEEFLGLQGRRNTIKRGVWWIHGLLSGLDAALVTFGSMCQP